MSSRLRIAHSCLRYPPATGGVERYVQDLVQLERAAGADIVVAASDLRTHHPPERLPGEALATDPAFVHRIPHVRTPGVNYPRLPGLAAALDRLAPAIVHGHAFWYAPADTAARWARKRGAPFVLHPYFNDSWRRKNRGWRLYRNTLGWQTFAAAEAVVVVSPQERAMIEQAGLPARRFVLLPPGVDFARFENPGPDPFRARGIEGRVMFSVGRIALGKRLDEAVAALPAILAHVPDVHLVIAGEDFGERAALEQQALRLGLERRVHLLGFLSDEELARAYAAADVLLHPSGYEAFGIVLAEAMAAGTPVVARRVGGVPWVVPDGRCGLLFSDSESLVPTLLRVLRDPILSRRLGDAGREYVRVHFGLEGMRAKLADLRGGLLAEVERNRSSAGPSSRREIA